MYHSKKKYIYVHLTTVEITMTNARLIDQNWQLLRTNSFWDPSKYTHTCSEFGSRMQLKRNYFKTALNAYFSRTNDSPTLHAVRIAHAVFLFLHQMCFFATHIKAKFFLFFFCFPQQSLWQYVITLKWLATNFEILFWHF